MARIKRYFAARFKNVSRAEGWGYAVWSAMGLVVFVPEVWAAVSGSDFVWPTISTTVGHLEDRWPVVALIPVAVIVMCAFSLYRVGAGDTAMQADYQGLGRTPEGRLAKQDVSLDQLERGGVPAKEGRREVGVIPYFGVVTVVVVAATFIAATSNNRFLTGYVLYSLIFVFWLVLPNVASYWFKSDVPFCTVFFTVRCLGQRLQLVAAFVAALLVILLLHLAFYPWPSVR